MKNCHLQHCEDLLFTQADPLAPLNVLQQVYRNLIGTYDNIKVSIKWDGSPAFVCGNDPENEKFFIGTKSVFSGKKYYTVKDILDDGTIDSGLQTKLLNIYDAFCDVHFPNVLQGDLLWCGYPEIGDGGIILQPNTLKYKLLLSYMCEYENFYRNIGAIFHTTYTGGPTLKDMEAHFGAVNPFRSNCDNFSLLDSNLDLHQMEPVCQSLLINCWPPMYGATVSSIWRRSPIYLKHQLTTFQPKDVELIQSFINWSIKYNTPIDCPSFSVYVWKKCYDHCEKLKTVKGKSRYRDDTNRFIFTFTVTEWDMLFEFYLELIKCKNRLIHFLDYLALDTIGKQRLQIYLPDGTPCGHEGYVVTTPEHTVKLVEREVFSKANFNYEKDWQK